jgi:hypothetical protein
MLLVKLLINNLSEIMKFHLIKKRILIHNSILLKLNSLTKVKIHKLKISYKMPNSKKIMNKKNLNLEMKIN